MSVKEPSASGAHPLERVGIRPVGIDDWSQVRHLHAVAFRNLALGHVEATAIEAFRDFTATPEYTEQLQQIDLAAAWLDGHMVGTCGWLPADDTGTSARITALYVDPLFTRLGIGRRLVHEAEERARAGGFDAFSTRATGNAVAFFEALGYEVSSHGVAALGGGGTVPVTFLRKHEGAAKRAAGRAFEDPPAASGGTAPSEAPTLVSPRER